jgi:hypothetical protein
MIAITNDILNTIIAMPAKYPFSFLFQTLQLDLISFKKYMRSSNIEELTNKVA